jgi:hypothetical protein
MKINFAAIAGLAVSVFALTQPAHAQTRSLETGIDLVTTMFAYSQVCAQWTGPITGGQMNLVVEVAKAHGFQPENKEHIGLVAAKALERGRQWMNSASPATRCTEAKFALTN